VSDHCAHRREMLLRTAKSCGPDARRWRQVGGVLSARPGFDKSLNPQAMVTTSRSPGRARRKPLKPLRAGAPGDPAVPVVTTRVLSTFAHEAADAAGIRRSPRPLFRGEGFWQTPGASRREIAGVYLGVIARSESDEAIHFRMPRYGLLRGACHRAALCADPLARNDDVRLFENRIGCNVLQPDMPRPQSSSPATGSRLRRAPVAGYDDYL
jgi:hypothetical protein